MLAITPKPHGQKDNKIAKQAIDDRLASMPARRSIWIVTPPGTGLLNLCGAWEVFSHANDLLEGGGYDLRIYGPVGPHITTGHGLLVGRVQRLPRSIEQAPHILIVAGGSAFKPPPSAELAAARWLKRHAHRFKTIVSICAGAFVLGEAGLLDGRKATTHWMALPRLAACFPKARVVDEGIFVRDGSVWTSAGITAGIDLCLALLERDHGHRLAMQVAQRLVLFLRRSGTQAQFSAALERQTSEPARLDELTSFVVENLQRDLRVARVAQAMGMSPRTLTRWCQEHLKESPAEVVRRLRVEEAARLLSSSTFGLKQIAHRTGLGDPSTLWRLFVKQYGVTPDEYRQRFSSVLAS